MELLDVDEERGYEVDLARDVRVLRELLVPARKHVRLAERACFAGARAAERLSVYDQLGGLANEPVREFADVLRSIRRVTVLTAAYRTAPGRLPKSVVFLS